jgi:hypothetical protein
LLTPPYSEGEAAAPAPRKHPHPHLQHLVCYERSCDLWEVGAASISALPLVRSGDSQAERSLNHAVCNSQQGDHVTNIISFSQPFERAEVV